MILELVHHHFRIIGRRSLLKRHRIVDGEILLPAVRSFGDYKITLRILNGLSILVCGKDLGDRRSIRVQRDSYGSLRMVQAITHSDNRKHDQSRNLDDVNRCVHRRCAGDAAETNIGDPTSKKWTKDDHEQWTGDGCVEGVRPDLPHHIADDESRNTNHQSWINPVIKVARPTHHELGYSRESVCVGLTQKRLFREEVRRTRPWIEFGKFRVCDGRGQTKQQGGENTEPHPLRGHRRTVRGLNEKCEPQKCARRDQRHCVNCQTAQTQCGPRGWFLVR